jgi:dolichol kinase
MAKFIIQIGNFLFFSKKHKTLRGSVVFILSNFLFLASIVFFVEIVLIFLGMGNIFVPLTRPFSDFLAHYMFG